MKHRQWGCRGEKDSETLGVERDGDGSIRMKPRMLSLATPWIGYI